MDHRVEADHGVGLDVPDVHPEGLDLRHLGPEGARGKQVGIEPDYLMVRLCEQGNQDRADVAVVTSDKNAQGSLLETAGCATVGWPTDLREKNVSARSALLRPRHRQSPPGPGV